MEGEKYDAHQGRINFPTLDELLDSGIKAGILNETEIDRVERYRQEKTSAKKQDVAFQEAVKCSLANYYNLRIIRPPQMPFRYFFLAAVTGSLLHSVLSLVASTAISQGIATTLFIPGTAVCWWIAYMWMKSRWIKKTPDYDAQVKEASYINELFKSFKEQDENYK